MERIRVIQVGLGDVGIGVTKALLEKRGVEIVGALDIAKDKVGKDLGEIAEIGRWLGVIVTDDADSLFSKTHADVLINATTYCPMHELYREITKPIEHGMNIITASVEGSRHFYADPGIAAQLNKLLKKHGVTYLGTGSSTAQDRVLMSFIEQCIEVRKIKLTTHGNVAELSEAAKRSYGIGLTPEEYRKHIENGSIARLPTTKQELAMISDRLGWQLDEIRERLEPFPGGDKQTTSTAMIYEGIKDGKVRIQIERIVEVLTTRQHGRFSEITVEGIPSFNVVIHSVGPSNAITVGCLVNAIPYVINAPPGIIGALDLSLSFALPDDVKVSPS